MVTVGVLVRMEAKSGHELDVETFLREGLPLVEDEPGTPMWFAMRIAPSTFAIFDAFDTDEDRQAHLSGKLANALRERAGELFAEPPAIELVDLIAVKAPREAAIPAQG